MGNPEFDSLKRHPAEEEDDNPPGAPAYASGPLAIQKPKPTPKPK